MKLCFESSDCVETFFLSCGPDEVSRLCCLVWRAKLSAVSSKTCSIDSTSTALLHPYYTLSCHVVSRPNQTTIAPATQPEVPKGHTAAYCGILTAKRQWHWKWHWSNVQISALWNCVASRMSKCKLWSAPPWGVALKQRCNPSFWFFFVFVLEKHLCPGFCLHV